MAATKGAFAMTLAEELQKTAAQFAPMIPGFIRKMMDKADADRAASGLAEGAMQVGDAAPDFELPDAEGNVVRRADLLAAGPLVVSFYCGGWNPFCRTELRTLQGSLAEMQAAGGRLVAISPELAEKSSITVARQGLEFPVLCDAGNAVARQFRIMFAVPKSLRLLFKQFGLNIPGHNGDNTWEIPLPATYVLDASGAIRFAFVNADWKLRAEPADVVAAVKALGG